MSYDLYFYKKKTSSLTENEVSDYLNLNFPLNVSDEEKQWFYSNEETGVYFGIDWNEPETEPEEIDFWDNFDDFKYLNFNFSINFIRPNFFAYEVFPILQKIIEDLDIYILNPQDEFNAEHPQKFENGYFEKQWIIHNEKLVLENFESFQVNYFPLEKSNYLWNFQFNREQIQESLDEDIFVAGYFIIQNKTDNQLYTFCVWPNHIPIVFPPVDYVIIQKEYRKLFRTTTESGIVSFEKIKSEMGAYLENFECEVPNLTLLKPQHAEKIAKKFNALEIEDKVEDFGEFVSFDRIVNVKI